MGSHVCEPYRKGKRLEYAERLGILPVAGFCSDDSRCGDRREFRGRMAFRHSRPTRRLHVQWEHVLQSVPEQKQQEGVFA